MSSSIVIHVLRPYATEEEYLARERFSIDSKSMLLIDQPPLPVDTAVVFDVQLENGQKPIRAEARVIGYVAATGTTPGGLRVRFKRFGAATKSFIDRAIAPPPAPASARPTPSLVPSPLVAPPEPVAPLVTEIAASHEPRQADRRESSGIHRRPIVPVAAPANREELLERLRTRVRSATRPSDVGTGEQTAKSAG